MARLSDRPGVDPKEKEAAFAEFERSAALIELGVGMSDWGFRSTNVFDAACERNHRRSILARLAMRLRRYHDQHGRFPAKLDELCDADMPKIRLDWFKNVPIAYSATATGFRLEVPDEILSKIDADRKAHENPPAPEFIVVVEIKDVKKNGPRR
jgi:hypothetical protein